MAISIKEFSHKFKLLDKIDFCNIEDYINYMDNKKLKDIMVLYGYKIKKIYYNEVDLTLSNIQFENNLVVPVKKVKYNKHKHDSLVKLLTESKILKSKLDEKIKTLFAPAYFDFDLQISTKMDIINIKNNIYKDFIYNYFKYDFSRVLQESSPKGSKGELLEMIEKYNDNNEVFQISISGLVNIITKIMAGRIVNTEDADDTSLDSTGKTDGTKAGTKAGNDRIILKICQKTKKHGKCGVNNMFCGMDKANKECYLKMDKSKLDYFSYLLANDLITNKMESRELLNGSFIPEFNMRNKIFRNPDEIIISPAELAGIIENGVYSKYKQNIKLSDILTDDVNKDYIFDKKDYDIIENTNFEEFKKIMNTVINEVVDLSIRNVLVTDKIFTTPFTKDGVYDQTSHLSECKFPFFGKNKKYVYQCAPRTQGFMCPTKLDYTRKPDKWGYCPELIEVTKERMGVIEIDAVGDDNKDSKDYKDYKGGRCNFPYFVKDKIASQYHLKYDCTEGVTADDIKFSWCPLKYVTNAANGKIKSKLSARSSAGDISGSSIGSKRTKKLVKEEHQSLLVAATGFDKVKSGKWWDGKLSITGLSSIKKAPIGYCQSPRKSKDITDITKAKDFSELTLENYIPNNCNINRTPSKGGYKREQLINFGINYLKIPASQMYKGKDSDIILPKGKLCKIINNKYRDIKTRGIEVTDAMRLKAYEKDIDNCDRGESKGGYSLKELQELAINFFKVDEKTALALKKPELCKTIRNMIKTIKNKTKNTGIHGIGDGDGEAAKQHHDQHDHHDQHNHHDQHQHQQQPGTGTSKGKYNMIYPADITQCKDTPNRGGKNIKEIKKLASDNFGIEIEHKTKDQLCDEILAKLKETQLHKVDIVDKDESVLDLDEVMKGEGSIDELFDEISSK